MAWAAYESLRNNLDDDGHIQVRVALLALLIFGGMSLVFLGALVWAFRARVVIDGDQMTVRGVINTTVVTPDRMNGFRYLNGQCYLYLKDRKFGLQIYGFENLPMILQWIRQRTHDVGEALLEEEDVAISEDQSLGFTKSDKEARLRSLRKTIHRANYPVYGAAAVGLINFLFVENDQVELVAVGILVLVPLLLDVLALSNRGHVRIDYDEGSRYPQILTGTLVAGVALAMISLLDRGTLLNGGFYDWLIVLITAKGLLWVLIDLDRLRSMLKRGRLITTVSIIGMLIISGFWIGGSLYQANKLLDTSEVRWHDTVIVEKKISSARTTSYTVALAPWDPGQKDVVEYTLRRAEFEVLGEGMRVRVGVRQGAVGIPWASDLQAVPDNGP